MPRRTASLGASALVAVALAAAGCGGGDDGGGQGGAPAGGDAALSTNTVQVEDFKFMPRDIAVEPGTRVTWTNRDSAKHTATSDRGGGLNTGTINGGERKSLTLREAGTFTYHCTFHPFMQAKVTVK